MAERANAAMIFESLALVYIGLLLVKTLFTLLYCRSHKINASLDGPKLAGRKLTVAQAILSGDPILEFRLETNLLNLSHQKFIWFLDEDDFEANRICQGLVEKYKQCDVRIVFCSPCPSRVNPKIWKLKNLQGQVTTPFLCVLDDDTTLPVASAESLVSAVENSKKMIATALPFYLNSLDLPSALLGQFVNNNSALTYLGSSFVVGAITLNGMGYVMRTELFEELEGLKPILNSLTDDLALANYAHQNAISLFQSPSPLFVHTRVKNFRHYFQMMHRWYVFSLLLFFGQNLKTQMVIFLLNAIPAMIFIVLLFSPGLFVMLLIARTLVMYFVQRHVLGKSMLRPFVSTLSELLQTVHLIHALIQKTLRWRTRIYRVNLTGNASGEFNSV